MAEHKNHTKHTKLEKPTLGEFGRNELSILGTPCGNIKELSRKIIESLGSDFNIAYVDADHKSADAGDTKDELVTSGGSRKFTDKIDYLQMDWKSGQNQFQKKKWFQDQDLILINGNHFESSLQIAVIDEKKPLEKKLGKLTNVGLILRKDGQEIPSYVTEHVQQLPPVIDFDNISEITSWIRDFLISKIPPLNGLVLAGGKSLRMNTDKGLINYHGVPQREYAWSLLNEFCKTTHISCREDQIEEINESFNPLPDTFNGLGPFGGILSAFRKHPDSAWLTVASDLPLLDSELIQTLIENRNPSKVATSYWDPEHKFPEPLVTIWEPRAYAELLHFLSLGQSCPRKTLINSDVHLIESSDTTKLMNVNYPEEYELVMERINSG